MSGDSRDPWQELERQLAELNELAEDQLRTEPDGEPPPAGLPPAGSWIRAINVNLDGVHEPNGPWHLVTGWNGRQGCISVRCSRQQPGWALREAVDAHVGRPRWSRNSSRDPRLLVSPGAPAEACRRCEASLARDAGRERAEEQQRELDRLAALLPAIGDLANDPTIDDVERGRRLRVLWPQGGGA